MLNTKLVYTSLSALAISAMLLSSVCEARPHQLLERQVSQVAIYGLKCLENTSIGPGTTCGHDDTLADPAGPGDCDDLIKDLSGQDAIVTSAPTTYSDEKGKCSITIANLQVLGSPNGGAKQISFARQMIGDFVKFNAAACFGANSGHNKFTCTVNDPVGLVIQVATPAKS